MGVGLGAAGGVLGAGLAMELLELTAPALLGPILLLGRSQLPFAFIERGPNLV